MAVIDGPLPVGDVFAVGCALYFAGVFIAGTLTIGQGFDTGAAPRFPSSSPPLYTPPYTPLPGIAPQQPQRGDNVGPGTSIVDPGVCTVETFPPVVDGHFQLPPFSFSDQQGPVWLAANTNTSNPTGSGPGHYSEGGGGFRVGFDPAKADLAVKLGYESYLYNGTPEGISIVSPQSWFDKGLASLESGTHPGLKVWQGNFLDAIHNTNTINFLVDGIDIFVRPNRFDRNAEPRVIRTHWEMDEIIKRGYLGKLHLWENGQEITGQEKLDWLQTWMKIRGL